MWSGFAAGTFVNNPCGCIVLLTIYGNALADQITFSPQCASSLYTPVFPCATRAECPYLTSENIRANIVLTPFPIGRESVCYIQENSKFAKLKINYNHHHYISYHFTEVHNREKCDYSFLYDTKFSTFFFNLP